MACLNRKNETRLLAVLEGVRVRRCVQQARMEFEQAVKDIEGNESQIYWSQHSMFFKVRAPSPPAASASKQQPAPNQPTSSKDPQTVAESTPSPKRQLPQSSKQARLRQLRLKRDRYVHQLSIVEQKIRERERRKSPFQL